MRRILAVAAVAGFVACKGGDEGPGAPAAVTLRFPAVAQAVPVSSARFLGVDAAEALSNSQLRNCRFGRVDKIPLAPVVVEISGEGALRFQGQPAADLPALKEAMGKVAASSRELADSACHPWRASPDDPAVTPTLLIAADASASARALAQVSQAAAEAGLQQQALWVEARASASLGAGAADGTSEAVVEVAWAEGAWSLPEVPEGLPPLGAVKLSAEVGTTQHVAEAMSALRQRGVACTRLVGEGGEAPQPQGELREQKIAQMLDVLPILASEVPATLPSMERCGPLGDAVVIDPALDVTAP